MSLQIVDVPAETIKGTFSPLDAIIREQEGISVPFKIVASHGEDPEGFVYAFTIEIED